MRRICSTMLVAGFALTVACGGSSYGGGGGPTDPGGGNTCPAGTVCMLFTSFSPTSLTVARNSTVTFSNTSTVDHNILFDTPIPAATTDIGPIGYGTSTTRAFGTAGTYKFHCTIHPGMNGEIVVQ